MLILNGQCLALILYQIIELCVLPVRVISSWGSGTKPPHYPNTIPSSGQTCESVLKSGSMLAALRKSSPQLSAHTLPAQL